MSSADLTRAPRRSERRSKTTLFCPSCGHESPATEDGDWRVTERVADGERRLAYDCPVCSNTLTVQPQYAALAQ